MDICSSPQLIAAYHVFLRLLVPRHPPCALNTWPFFVCAYRKISSSGSLLTRERSSLDALAKPLSSRKLCFRDDCFACRQVHCSIHSVVSLYWNYNFFFLELVIYLSKIEFHILEYFTFGCLTYHISMICYSMCNFQGTIVESDFSEETRWKFIFISVLFRKGIGSMPMTEGTLFLRFSTLSDYSVFSHLTD